MTWFHDMVHMTSVMSVLGSSLESMETESVPESLLLLLAALLAALLVLLLEAPVLDPFNAAPL